MGVARRSQCQASQNSSLGALNLSARAEGFASPGRRGERKVGRREGEDHLEERLLSHKYVTILRMTIMTTLSMRTTTTTITMTKNPFHQAQHRSHLCPPAQLDVLVSRPQLPQGAQMHPLFTLRSINSWHCLQHSARQETSGSQRDDPGSRSTWVNGRERGLSGCTPALTLWTRRCCSQAWTHIKNSLSHHQDLMQVRCRWRSSQTFL